MKEMFEEKMIGCVLVPSGEDEGVMPTLYIGKEKEKVLERVNKMKKRLGGEVFEVEIENDENFCEGTCLVSCDEKMNPVKAWMVFEKEDDENDLLCEIVRI